MSSKGQPRRGNGRGREEGSALPAGQLPPRFCRSGRRGEGPAGRRACRGVPGDRGEPSRPGPGLLPLSERSAPRNEQPSFGTPPRSGHPGVREKTEPVFDRVGLPLPSSPDKGRQPPGIGRAAAGRGARSGRRRRSATPPGRPRRARGSRRMPARGPGEPLEWGGPRSVGPVPARRGADAGPVAAGVSNGHGVRGAGGGLDPPDAASPFVPPPQLAGVGCRRDVAAQRPPGGPGRAKPFSDPGSSTLPRRPDRGRSPLGSGSAAAIRGGRREGLTLLRSVAPRFPPPRLTGGGDSREAAAQRQLVGSGEGQARCAPMHALPLVRRRGQQGWGIRWEATGKPPRRGNPGVRGRARPSPGSVSPPLPPPRERGLGGEGGPGGPGNEMWTPLSIRGLPLSGRCGSGVLGRGRSRRVPSRGEEVASVQAPPRVSRAGHRAGQPGTKGTPRRGVPGGASEWTKGAGASWSRRGRPAGPRRRRRSSPGRPRRRSPSLGRCRRAPRRSTARRTSR